MYINLKYTSYINIIYKSDILQLSMLINPTNKKFRLLVRAGNYKKSMTNRG